MDPSDGSCGGRERRGTGRERRGAGHPGVGPGTGRGDVRLQDAFAEGRLDDAEFDARMRSALSARTRADLDGLLADLPAAAPAASQAAVAGRSAGKGPGRLNIAFKSSVRRSGRWRVPDRHTSVVYKGSGWLDLRAAELTAPVTTLLAVAYKSRITILVRRASGSRRAGSAPTPHRPGGRRARGRARAARARLHLPGHGRGAQQAARGLTGR